MFQTLRRKGDSLVIAIPEKFIEQNNLREGSKVHLAISGTKLTVNMQQRPHYVLAELMAEMPTTLPLADGWDEMPPTAKEAP